MADFKSFDFAKSAPRSTSENDEGPVSVNPEGVFLAIAKGKSKVENRFARVAKLADAPDFASSDSWKGQSLKGH